ATPAQRRIDPGRAHLECAELDDLGGVLRVAGDSWTSRRVALARHPCGARCDLDRRLCVRLLAPRAARRELRNRRLPRQSRARACGLLRRCVRSLRGPVFCPAAPRGATRGRPPGPPPSRSPPPLRCRRSCPPPNPPPGGFLSPRGRPLFWWSFPRGGRPSSPAC